MTTIVSVIGSHQKDTDRLILLGDDSAHYELELPLGTLVDPRDRLTGIPRAGGDASRFRCPRIVIGTAVWPRDTSPVVLFPLAHVDIASEAITPAREMW